MASWIIKKTVEKTVTSASLRDLELAMSSAKRPVVIALLVPPIWHRIPNRLASGVHRANSQR
jgi:hypothetical protein